MHRDELWKKLRESALRNSKAMNVEPPKTLIEDERNPPIRVPDETDSLDSAADLSAIGAMSLGNRNGGGYGGDAGSDGDFENDGHEGQRQLGHQNNGEISAQEYEDAPLHDGQDQDYEEQVGGQTSFPSGRYPRSRR